MTAGPLALRFADRLLAIERIDSGQKRETAIIAEASYEPKPYKSTRWANAPNKINESGLGVYARADCFYRGVNNPLEA
jgi:hypothetical protein